MSKNSDKIKRLKTSLKGNPSDVVILSLLVEAYLRCGDAKNARKPVDDFVKQFGDAQVQIRFLWGKIHEAEKHADLANRYYKQAFDWYEQEPSSRTVEIYTHLGNYWRQKEDARAFHCYHRAYQLGCRDAVVIEQLNTIFTAFVELFNQRWFIVQQQDKVFAYSTRQTANFPSVQLNQADSSTWCQAITHFLLQSQWVIDLELFTLPILLERSGVTCQDKTAITQLRRKFSCPSDELPINRVAYRAMRCFLDALEQGTQQALQSFVQDWVAWELDALSLTFAARLWHKLYHCGWFQTNSVALLEQVFAQYGDVLNVLPPETSATRFVFVRDSLNYSIQSFEEWNATLFRVFIVPSVHFALQNKNYFYADRLAVQTDFSYAQQPMTEAQQLLCRNAYVNETRQAGKMISDTLAKLPLPQHQKPVTIAFVTNLVFNETSPMKVLFDILQKVSQLSPVPLIAKVYAFYGFSEHNPAEKQYLTNKFSSVGVEIVDVAARRGKHLNNDDYLERLLFLRKLMQKDEISVAIYVQCSTFFIIFASAVRLAPIQTLFSMAVEGTFRLPELDAYLAGSLIGNKTVMHGYEWRTVEGIIGEEAIHSKYPAQDSQRAKQIRAQFPTDAVIFGSMGRPQKIDNDVFLDMVAEILRRCPKAIFLWFGKEALAGVKGKMESRGILDRCLFQGWVNIHEYSRVLDIHVDSYPFGTGLTMFASMALGVPAVFFHQERNTADVDSSILSIGDLLIYPIWSGMLGDTKQQVRVKSMFTDENGENLFLHATNFQEYVAHVLRLFEDEEFRKRVGKACQEFMNFVEEINISKQGESFAQHICEIIEEYCSPSQ